MNTFKYKARDSSGKLISAHVQAFSQAEAVRSLYEKQLTLLHIKETRPRFFAPTARVKLSDLTLWFRKLSFMVETGATIPFALTALVKQTKSPYFHQILSDVRQDVLSGIALSESMQKHKAFPRFAIGMVQIGEVTGRLDQMVTKTADYYDREIKLKNDVKGALMYPLFISVLMMLLVLISVFFVVPSYTVMFKMNDLPLPLPTIMLINISDFLIHYIVVIMGGLVAVICLLLFSKSTPRGRLFFDTLYLNVPLVNIYIRKSFNFKFAEALCILTASGITILDSMEIVQMTIDNTYIKRHFHDVLRMLHQGNRLSDCIRDFPHYDPLFIDLVHIGEETGQLEKTMEKCAEYLGRDTERYIKNATKLLEPAITLILGAVLGFIMMAIMLPSFTLIETI